MIPTALGALGRRFALSRPDHLKPSHISELTRLAFLLGNLSTPKVDRCNVIGLIVPYCRSNFIKIFFIYQLLLSWYFGIINSNFSYD